MFGKKKKQAKLEQEQQAVVAEESVQSIPPQNEENTAKIFYESEIIEDDEEDTTLPKEYESIAYIIKQETGEDLLAQPVDDEKEEEPALEPALQEVAPALEEVAPVLEEAEEPAELEEIEEAEEVEELEEIEEAPASIATNDEEDKEEVVYVVDGPSEDDDEIVKPAKLVKLPNLVDYMLSQNMSKQMKINIATLLLSTYNKYKDIPAEKKIVVQCMAKVMKSLIQG